MTDLDIPSIRAHFPAFDRIEGGRPAAYLDGPGGTQVPSAVIEAMATVLSEGVSNLGGPFGASEAATRITEQARQAMAAMFNADPSEIAFGQNMTSITFAVSRALARSWRPGDSIVVTSLDHDANFTPWARAAEDAGVSLRIAEFDPATGTFDPEAVAGVLDESVRLVAVCVASNALGTVVDVAAIASMAREAGAMTYLDAVHAAPHRLLDARAFDCDFLVASAYKFFGPHTGVLYGKLDRLAALDAYRVRPAPSDPPGKMETGTQSFESLAGVAAAVDYLAGLTPGSGTPRTRLEAAYDAIADHEGALASRFLEGIGSLPGVRLHGVQEPEGRVPTFALEVEGTHPDAVVVHLASAGIYAWAGHYYAVNVMDRLGKLESGGLTRIGFVHYNDHEEVDRALEALGDL